ncbi:MAG: ATP synthase F0 subunit C [Thermoanaerobaculum sp.]|nr:ATP synthase F0 subunit C [Thermoanaerobaculum sp.]MCX7895511.1 ATP synthase F0 subunit C [Thermoanaerobaculum sp.]MDW7967340.1 ATP synthase F0 subunit C [Thermoanaerobaculum sp.]
MKKALVFSLVLLGFLLAMPAAAAEEAATTPAGQHWRYISAALVLGIAAFAGAFGQAKAIAAACTSMGRNPGAAGAIRLALILGLAFIESLVLYALLIAILSLP